MKPALDMFLRFRRTDGREVSITYFGNDKPPWSPVELNADERKIAEEIRAVADKFNRGHKAETQQMLLEDDDGE